MKRDIEIVLSMTKEEARRGWGIMMYGYGNDQERALAKAREMISLGIRYATVKVDGVVVAEYVNQGELH